MRKLRNWFLKALGIALIMVAVVAGTFYWLFIGVVPEANFPPPSSLAEAQAQDIEWARTYASLDRSFSDGEQRRYQAHLDTLVPQAGTLSAAAFDLEFSKAVALADNAHTNVSPISRSRRHNRLPVRFGWFESDLHIVQTTVEHQALLGLKVTGFDETSTEAATQALLSTFGGPQNRRRFMATLPLSSPALLHAAGLVGAPDQLTLHFENAAPATLVALEANAESAVPYGRTALEYPVRERDAATWVSLMQGREPPITLQNQGVPYVRQHLPGLDAFYVKLNFNYAIEGWDMAAWLKDAEADMRALGPRYIIVDLRFNGGGTDITSPLAKALPNILPPDGLLFIVTSDETFSAGVGAAADFKLYLGERARVVGAPVGDRLRFWANGGSPFQLPNSKITVPVWRALEDYKDGCWSVAKCFWLSPGFMRKGVETLKPDLPAKLTFEAYVAGRDPAMEAIQAEVKARSQTD